jgi:prepilin-type N-terminal cleavage/methylation domain-containing protein
MSGRNESGFTIVELVVAVVVLGIGVTALVGSSALVTRQVGRGREVTIASQVATQRLEYLRRESHRVPGSPCTSAGTNFASGAATTRGVSETWTVAAVAGTTSAYTATETVSYQRVGGTSQFTVSTIIGCF